MAVITQLKFIESLNMDGKCEGLAHLLLKNTEDCKFFYIKYLGRRKYLIDDLMDYREEKINQSLISLDEFLKLSCGVAKKEVFEQTFIESFTDKDINLINSLIASKKTSLSTIYNAFSNNINQSIFKSLL